MKPFFTRVKILSQFPLEFNIKNPSHRSFESVTPNLELSVFCQYRVHHFPETFGKNARQLFRNLALLLDHLARADYSEIGRNPRPILAREFLQSLEELYQVEMLRVTPKSCSLDGRGYSNHGHSF